MRNLTKQCQLTHCFTLAIGITPFATAASQSPATPRDTIVVTATQKSQFSPNYQREKEKLKTVAGGTNLTVIEKDTRLTTLHDTLDYQPGILVQNFFGGIDQPRLNIRGSGVQSAPLARGVLLMQDGLPMTDADGSFHISMLEMRDAMMVSVRRGANSLNPQSNSLGGELDVISYTGRNEQGRLRYEYGSHGREGLQAAFGGVSDDNHFDGRINFTYDHFDGYRKHSSSQRKTVRSNFGYVTDNFENRTWLNWTDLRFDVAGPVSEAVLNDNPTDVYPMVWLRDPHRNVEQFRVANRSDWQLGDQLLSAGLWHTRTHDSFTTPAYYRFSQSHSEGIQLTYNIETDSVTYRTAFAWDHMGLKTNLMQNRKGTPADKTLIGRYDGRAENLYGSVGVGLHLMPDLTLNLDLKGTHAKRDVDKRDKDVSLNQHWTFWTPKAGIIWHPTDNQRYFANISTSQEPTTFWEIINSSNGKLTKLAPQKGVTFEIGGEGQLSESLKWDLALYRSLIKDEYITTYDSEGNAVGVFNYAAKTRHQGFEAGLKGRIPVGSGDVEYRISWTYNDFRFVGGEYNGNYIAGIPRNIIATEVLYNIGNWRFGPNLHWMPTDTAVDHENHFDIQKHNHYAVLGFKGNYQPADNWSLYLSFDNLTRERYATTSVANRTVTKKDSTLFPGMGFSVNGGITYNF
ncbi:MULTISPECIES: TonB-dependent receptor domain-containing protein [Xenorhabdus]|uniref:TonB-dependent receptor family protein n=1 Tax=Xenorhabdus TaxID=626 RepID=UPI000647F954|nr:MULTISPECIES: TonB-dependent receptor [Xenorhabdus]